jgi:hypothetical protein
VFNPAKNTITKVAQPLPAQLPPSSNTESLPSDISWYTNTKCNTCHICSSIILDLDVAIEGAPASANTINEPEPESVQWCHIKVLPPLSHTASWQAFLEEHAMFQRIIDKIGVELQQDYAQMKLMDLENENLHQKAFGKDQQKAAKMRLMSDQAHHITPSDMIDLLA